MQRPGMGREQAQAEGQLAEVSGLVTQPLSGAFPRETTTRCASVVAAGLGGENSGGFFGSPDTGRVSELGCLSKWNGRRKE